jgi:hypothetical protein
MELIVEAGSAHDQGRLVAARAQLLRPLASGRQFQELGLGSNHIGFRTVAAAPPA